MRGQVAAIDALVAVLIFASVYAVLNAFYADITVQDDDFDFLALKAKIVSSNLFTSQGEPVTWNNSNVKQLGLVIDRGVIEQDKLANFLNLSSSNLTNVKTLLDINGLNFYFNLTYLNKTTVFVNSTNFKGLAVAGSSFSTSPAVYTSSIGVYNGKEVFVNIALGT
ncbi:MAG: hypothetical protein V1644_01715 [Candidatus Micrarchaeota archaeon]